MQARTELGRRLACEFVHGHVDADTDTDTATVNRVKTFEFRWELLAGVKLSSLQYVISGTYRVHMHQS